jgi:hypothetical protein
LSAACAAFWNPTPLLHVRQRLPAAPPGRSSSRTEDHSTSVRKIEANVVENRVFNIRRCTYAAKRGSAISYWGLVLVTFRSHCCQPEWVRRSVMSRSAECKQVEGSGLSSLNRDADCSVRRSGRIARAANRARLAPSERSLL